MCAAACSATDTAQLQLSYSLKYSQLGMKCSYGAQDVIHLCKDASGLLCEQAVKVC